MESTTLLLLLRLFYLGAAVGVLLVSLIPPLRHRFLSYGARASHQTKSESESDSKSENKARSSISATLDRIAAIRVPHDWFSSFYAVSIACSLFWALHFITNTGAAGQTTPAAATESHASSMTVRQVLVAWALMIIQATRRLYECHSFPASPNSQMWIGHWLLGILFYVATNVAVWIEGISAMQNHRFTLDDFILFGHGLDLRTFLSIILFILASGLQHDCHAYLASLKKNNNQRSDSRTEYKIPSHPAFSRLITPHYTAECLIYLSLAIFAAPQGAWLNGTLFCACVFVVTNLGVTADGTKRWYERKFGPAAVEAKWRMIPFVY